MNQENLAKFRQILPDRHLLRSHAVGIPLRLGTAPSKVTAAGNAQVIMFAEAYEAKATSANLSKAARSYIASVTAVSPDDDEHLSRAIWFHSLAIIYAPLYLSEHAATISGDWPRVPLPDSLATLEISAQLGMSVAQLLDAEKAALGVTTGRLRKELAKLGRITGPKGLSLSISAGWGHYQEKKKIVMPGRGLEKRREFTEEEKAAIAEGGAELALSAEAAIELFGRGTTDIYLNNDTHWSNVPEAVWEYTIGGYQVLKKWLSYREEQVLGRPIGKDEAREFTHLVRRIAALLLLEPVLDKNYLAIRATFYPWKPATRL